MHGVNEHGEPPVGCERGTAASEDQPLLRFWASELVQMRRRRRSWSSSLSRLLLLLLRACPPFSGGLEDKQAQLRFRVYFSAG